MDRALVYMAFGVKTPLYPLPAVVSESSLHSVYCRLSRNAVERTWKEFVDLDAASRFECVAERMCETLFEAQGGAVERADRAIQQDCSLYEEVAKPICTYHPVVMQIGVYQDGVISLQSITYRLNLLSFDVPIGKSVRKAHDLWVFGPDPNWDAWIASRSDEWLTVSSDEVKGGESLL